MRLVTTQKLFLKYPGHEDELKALLLEISPNLDIIMDDYIAIKQYCSTITEDIVFIGNHDVIQFAGCSNPTVDSDAQVWSDNPYLSDDNLYLITKRVGTRIPDEYGQNASWDYIKTVLENQIYWTKNKTTNIDWFNISAQAWQGLSGFLVNKFNMGHLNTAPTCSPDLYKIEDTHKKIAYINCHGGLDVSNFYGQLNNSYPIAVSVKDNQFQNCLVATEACYGVNIINKNKENSICLNAMYSKAIGFFGSTTVAYGASNMNSSLSCMDYLLNLFLEEAIIGTPLGLALQKAKMNYINNLMRTKGQLSGPEKKTILQATFYGLPNIVL